MDFWKTTKLPKRPIFSPVKVYTRANIKSIPKKKLTWPQAQVRYPKLRPFGDADRDGKLNLFDCRPFDKTRHGKLWRADIEKRIKIIPSRNKFTKVIRQHGVKNIKPYLVTKEKVIRTLEREPYLLEQLNQGRVKEIRIIKKEPTEFAAVGPITKRVEGSWNEEPVGRDRVLKISEVGIPGIGIGEMLQEERATMPKERADKLVKAMMTAQVLGKEKVEKFIKENFKDENPQEVEDEIGRKLLRYNARATVGRDVYAQNISDSIRHEIGHLIQEREGKLDLNERTSPEAYVEHELDVELRTKYPNIRKEIKESPETLSKLDKQYEI